MASAKIIVSVGYHFHLSEEQMKMVANVAKEATGKETDYDVSKEEIYAGVWYGPCYHGPRDCCKSQEDLKIWYTRKMACTERVAYLRQIYTHKKFVIGVFDCLGDRFYAQIINNRDGNATTQLKKGCGSGQFGSPIEIERQSVDVVPYIHIYGGITP